MYIRWLPTSDTLSSSVFQTLTLTMYMLIANHILYQKKFVALVLMIFCVSNWHVKNPIDNATSRPKTPVVSEQQIFKEVYKPKWVTP